MPWHPTLIDSRILAVHAALLPVGNKGTVVMLGGSEHNSAQGGTDEAPADPAKVDRTALYDVELRTSAVRISSPTTDVFCAGHAFAGDGRLLICGGTESWGGAVAEGPGGGHGHFHGQFGGHRACWVFNFRRNTWTRAADLNFEVGHGKGGGRWYPSLITLPNGDVAAFGGHPSRTSQHWHENDIPERYSAAGNFWTWYPNAFGFEHPTLPGNWYPRLTLVRGGWIFITTRHNNQCRLFDPETGNLVGPAIAPPPAPYSVGWDYAVITLPLVPGDGYRARVLAVGGTQPSFIELNLDAGAPTPAWANAGTRQGSAATKVRNYTCPVYLPTGQILVSGGINGTNDADAVKEPEVFTPNVDWATRAYQAGGIGTWATIEEPAQVARNYHSTALLLPDGSVLAAGSNINGGPGDPADVGQRNIELFFPPYFANAGRPQLTQAPTLLTYEDGEFTVTAGSTAQAAAVRQVALVRCGSVTHAADFDQRYVALEFTHEAGTANLRATFPDDASVVPPGFYMLWIVDSAGLPCQVARFVRVAHVTCDVITDRSTFSEEEVLSYPAGAAVFPHAVYAVFDGYLPGELPAAPSVTLTWTDTGDPVASSDVFLTATEPRWLEHPAAWEDVAQRVTYPYTVEIRNPALYAGFTDVRRVAVRFAVGPHSCTETLDLTKAPNPYMIDVDPTPPANPHWLSTDVRTFRIRAGEKLLGDISQGSAADAPTVFLRAVIDRLRGLPNDNAHPFRSLPDEGDAAAVDLRPFDGTQRVYNYAIAKVRYRATTTTAARVKVFFRLCTTAATGLEYNTATVYRHTGPGAGTVPKLGLTGSEIASIPFFLSPRVETISGRPGSAPMTAQPLLDNYEFQDIVPTAGAEVTAYFGCWLDINQPDVKRFPLMPGTSDGPWPEADCQPVQSFFRSPHQCLVAEVYFEDDETDAGETPGTSDNLSQRNLVLLHADNPGAPGSHLVLHPFEVKPSALGLQQPPLTFAAVVRREALDGAEPFAERGRRFGPDELLIRWHNLPPESEVTLYFSDIDTADIQRMAAAFRRSAPSFEVVDNHTVRFRVANGTWMPIPGGRTLNIPALLSVKLPDEIVSGQHFRISIHQVNGMTGRVIGSFQIDIPVSKAELILDREVQTLSLMRHIATTIPSSNRWHPIFVRYLNGLASRVDALGGSSGDVHPNPDGSGRPFLDGVATVPGAVRDLASAVRACCARMSLLLLVAIVLLILVLVLLVVLVLVAA